MFNSRGDTKADSEMAVRRRRRRRIKENENGSNTRKHVPSPPKPWGKAERFLVIGFLVVTSFMALSLAVTARSGKLPGLPRFGTNENMFTDRIIVENHEPVIATIPKSETMVHAWNDLTQNLSGIYGFYVLDLGTQESIESHSQEIYTAASLMKLPVLFALYRESEKGTVNLDQKYSLKASDKVGGSGGIQYKNPGAVYTYRELAKAMGQQSDNTAFRIVVNLLGETKVKQAINDLGMRNTDFDENTTTPEDIGIFFRKLWQAKLLSLTSRDEILTSLTKTIYEEHMAKGIPSDVRVAHKYGREVHVVNDAGIVYAKRTFVMVIMSKGVVETEADQLFPVLAQSLYENQTK